MQYGFLQAREESMGNKRNKRTARLSPEEHRANEPQVLQFPALQYSVAIVACSKL